MSDRIGQLTARLQAHGIDFRSAGGGRTVGALEPLDVAAAFGFIKCCRNHPCCACLPGKSADNQAIASYYYSVGNDRHGAVDVLYLILAREQHRQQTALINLLWRHCGGIDQDWSERKAAAMKAHNWPTSGQKNGRSIAPPKRLHEIACICIDEAMGQVKTNAMIASLLGISGPTYCNSWAQVINFARAEIAAAIARADDDILGALKKD